MQKICRHIPSNAVIFNTKGFNPWQNRGNVALAKFAHSKKEEHSNIKKRVKRSGMNVALKEAKIEEIAIEF